jgi:hypothetical protein
VNYLKVIKYFIFFFIKKLKNYFFIDLWKQTNGSFEFLNKDVNANLKIENMLELFHSIVIEQKEINKSYLEMSNFINKLKSK